METNKSIPKPKSRLLLFILTALLSVTTILSIQSPITVYADGMETDAEYADGTVGPSSDKKIYSTYAEGAGYKGQGVLLYLLEREGGGPVAGTTPKAYACSATVVGYELHAQDKYNRYGEVTSWESTPIYWAGSVPNNGGIMKGSEYSNIESIKSWLKTPTITDDGTGTQGIQMVETIWGSDIAERFTSEEILLIVEPIVANQYSQYMKSNLLDGITSDMSIESMINRLKMVRYAANTDVYDTVMNTHLASWIDTTINYYDSDDAKMAYQSNYIYESLRQKLYNEITSKDINTNIYKKLGDPRAGTAKKLIEYYNTLSPEYDGWFKAESGIYYYRRSAQRAAWVDSSTRICAKANFDLWPAGDNGLMKTMVHDDANINSKSTGMLAALAFSDDGGQTTYDEPKGDTPANPPDESDGLCTIIKSYRERKADGSVVDHGTFHLKQLSNNITIEDEPTFKVIAWKTSTTENTGISSLTWESSVPALIGETGSSTGTIVLPDSHKYLYILLEKSEIEELEDANYILTQSTIARHIKLNEPDNKTVEGSDMTLLKDITFKWALPAVKNSCDGHGWTHDDDELDGCTNQGTRSCNCGRTVCPSPCSTHGGTGTCLETCEDGCTTDHNGTCAYTEHANGCTNGQKYCAGHTATCTWGKWDDDKYQRLLKRNYTNNTSQRIIASNDNPNYNRLTKVDDFVEYAPTVETRTTLGYTYVPNSVGVKNFEFHTILHRGDTQVVIAEWKNRGSADYLRDISPNYNYTISNTIPARTGAVKDSDYTASFTVNIGDASPNKDTTRTIVTGSGHGNCSASTVYLGLISPSANGQNINATAAVKVYKAKSLTSNTDVNSAIQSDDLGNIHISGRMIKSGSITGFRPYVQMKYDTIYTDDQSKIAYVLGEETRDLYFNSYAEIEWTKKDAPNLTISSLQWSTHNEANRNHSPGTVLPGGATLTLSVKEADRQTVKVHTYQPVLMGAGLEQVTNTGGDSSLTDATGANDAHAAFVSSVKGNLEKLHLQQWFVDTDYAANPGGDRSASKDVFDNGGVVDNGDENRFNGFGGSIEEKYYFNTDESDDGTNQDSGEGDLDVKVGTTSTRYYLFWCDTQGNIRMATGNSADIANNPAGTVVCARPAYGDNTTGRPAITDITASRINDKTLVIDKLYDSLEKGGGSDPTASWAAVDGKWYNEAFDGVLYVENITDLTVGFSNSAERITVLDPKLCPQNLGTSDLFSAFHTTQIKTSPNVHGYTDDTVGVFTDPVSGTGADIPMTDKDMLFWSREFYIPNVTTQDLH